MDGPHTPGGDGSHSGGEYRCDHPGCGKGFTRKDHLVRHAANHSIPNFHCPICNRPFKRLDLLQRHEKRNICGPNAGSHSHNTHHSPSSYSPPTSTSFKRRRSSSSTMDHPHSSSNAYFPFAASTNPLPPPTTANHAMSYGAADPPPHTAPLAASAAPNSAGSGFLAEIFTIDNTALTDWTGHAPSLQPQPWENLLIDNLPGPYGEPALDLPHLFWGGAGTGGAASTSASGSSGGGGGMSSMGAYGNGVSVMGAGGVSGTRMQESAERGRGGFAEVAKREEERVGEAHVQAIKDLFPDAEMTVTYLSDCLAYYWTHTAPTYPFIHHGTFSLSLAPPTLLLMMAIVGSVHMPPPSPTAAPFSHRDWRKVVQRVRGQLVQECGLDMPISTIQAFCLCHVYDTWYGTAESLFVAQCMWPVMVAHSRKKGIGVAGRPEHEAQEEEAWAAWAKDEERRRAAYCVLLIDTQLSCFWNQHPSRQLSIFAHNLTLPCPRSQWEATSAQAWFRSRDPSSSSSSTPSMPLHSPTNTTSGGKKSRAGYLPGLHPEFGVANASEGYSASVYNAVNGDVRPQYRVDLENALGVEMILMGFMAVSWDCRTRGGMGMRFRDNTKHWRGYVLNATINLRAMWEGNVPPSTTSLEARDMRDTFAVAIISVLSDIPMLQVAAGATSICGATIGPRQYADAKRRLKLWARSDDAWTCLWQSARFLRQALWQDWGVYTPWAVFLTTLVHWAYSTSTSPLPSDRLPAPTDPADAYHSSLTLLDGIISSPHRLEALEIGVSDLIGFAISKLEERKGQSEVVGECASLLARLVGAGGGGGRGRRDSDWSVGGR